MKFKMNTAKLNAILSKVAKGVGNGKIMPVTEYLNIVLGTGSLSITATDSVNFITYTDAINEGEAGRVVVKADALIKLVQKTTKPEMEFTMHESYLEVKGNGTYKIPLYESNEYLEYKFDHEAPVTKVSASLLKRVFQVNKSAIADDMLMPCLAGFYLSNRAVTTDGVRMCMNDVSLFPDAPTLVTQELADLLNVLGDDEVSIQRDGNKLLFTTPTIEIFGTELDGIEQYPDISGVLGMEHPHQVTVKKADLESSLDRLSIFVTSVDSNAIVATFSERGINLTDARGAGLEHVPSTTPWSDEVSEQQFPVNLNLAYLQSLIGVLEGETLTISYTDNQYPITIHEGPVVLILSTVSFENEAQGE